MAIELPVATRPERSGSGRGSPPDDQGASGREPGPMTATDQITCREPEDDSRDGLAIRALRRRRRAAAAVRRGARPTMTTRSARVAIALMALHVVDDSFLQPPPGTTFAGHLPSGLVPLAVLVALSWAFPRIRPGARAAV